MASLSVVNGKVVVCTIYIVYVVRVYIWTYMIEEVEELIRVISTIQLQHENTQRIIMIQSPESRIHDPWSMVAMLPNVYY